MRRVIFQLLLVAIIGSISSAEPAPAIGDVIRNPQSYHLHAVVLQGTVRQVHPLAPFLYPRAPYGSKCYGAYTFTLHDETGSIAVEVLGVCANADIGTKEWPTQLSDGDKASIKATINAPGVYAGTEFTHIDPSKVRAVVLKGEITKLN